MVGGNPYKSGIHFRSVSKNVAGFYLNNYDDDIFMSDRIRVWFFGKFVEEKDSVPKMLAYAISEMKKTENLRVGIKAFTAISNYSQSHLSRLIKKFFNMTLKQYINELRLQKAYNCIVFTQNSFEDIADELGFASYSHFNKIFKTRFYITPGALRKEKGIWTA